MINRDILGFCRRALRLGVDPPAPDLLGLIQPTVNVFAPLADDIQTIRQTNVLPAAAGTVAIDLGINRHGVILLLWVSFSVSRILTVELAIARAAASFALRFYQETNVVGEHAVIGSIARGPDPTVIPNLYFPTSLQANTGTQINLLFGAGILGDVMTTQMMWLAVGRDDPIPL